MEIALQLPKLISQTLKFILKMTKKIIKILKLLRTS